MAVHHILIDSYTSLLSHSCQQESLNEAQKVSNDLYQAISNILRGAKCERFTFHIFNSTLPSPPRCETQQMSPRTLGNIQNEIMTNLQLTDLNPIQNSTTDDSWINGVSKVLLRLIRKVTNVRVMHSAKPLRHTVYLFSSVPERYEKAFSKNEVTLADVKHHGNAAEPNNSLHEVFSKLADCHVRLVWVNLGTRNEGAQAQQPRQRGIGSKPFDSNFEENFPVRVKSIHSFLRREQPKKQLLASSLQKRIETTRNASWQNVGSRINAQIVFEQPGEYSAKLKLLTSVTIHSLQSSSKGKRSTNLFLLSHYLKNSEPFAVENALSAKRSHARTLRPGSSHDVSSFSSFIRYLKQSRTVAVAKEISADHSQRTVSCGSVVIMPFSKNVATLHRLPKDHSFCPSSQDSKVLRTYDQWTSWYNGGREIQDDSEVKSTQESLVLNETALLSADVGPEDKAVSGVTFEGKCPQQHRNHVGNERCSDSIGLTTGRLDEHPTSFPGHSVGKKNSNARRKTTRSSTNPYKSTEESPRTVPASQRTSDNPLKSAKTRRRFSAVTKNGFRYKRLTFGSSEQDNADGRAHGSRSRRFSNSAPEPITILNSIQRGGTEGASVVNGGEAHRPNSWERKLEQHNKSRISDFNNVNPKRMPSVGTGSENAEPENGQKRLDSSKSDGRKYISLSCKRQEQETEGVLKSTSTELLGNGDTRRENSDGLHQKEQKQVDENLSPLNHCLEHALKEEAIREATESPVGDEQIPALTSWENALHQAMERFEAITVQLSSCSDTKRNPLVHEAMRSLSRISVVVSRQSKVWTSLSGVVTRRLKDPEIIIDSIQAAQKRFYSNESEQAKSKGGNLWRVMIDGFEQVMWLMAKTLDPDIRTSKKRKRKPDILKRATTLLSCIQVTGQLTSSLFESPELFNLVFDSFFHSVLIHFAQTSPNEELNYWARDVFEHFEKEVIPRTVVKAHPNIVKGTIPSEPNNGKARDLSFRSSKAPDRIFQHEKKRKVLNMPNHSSRNNIKQTRSQFFAGKKLMAGKPETLKHHPAFRRGKAFIGHTRKKRKTAMKKTTPKTSCPTNALDRLVHTGSLQSSLDAIKLPESSDDDLDGEEIEASDKECVEVNGHTLSKSERQSMKNPAISSDLNLEYDTVMEEDRSLCDMRRELEEDWNAETEKTEEKPGVTPCDRDALGDRNASIEKTSELSSVVLRSTSIKEGEEGSIQPRKRDRWVSRENRNRSGHCGEQNLAGTGSGASGAFNLVFDQARRTISNIYKTAEEVLDLRNRRIPREREAALES